MAYSVNVLKTPADCRTVMARAKFVDPNLYRQVFRRLCDLEEQKYADPLEREFWSTVTAYEQLLSEKNGRTTRASRTRAKIKRLGGGIEAITQMLEEWAIDPTVTTGFGNLLEAGLPELMAEYIVAYRFPHRFSEAAVVTAKAKLAKHGIVVEQSQ